MFTVPSKAKQISLILMAIGILALIVGFVTDSDRAWASLLVNNFFFLVMALGSTFFLAVQFASQAGWSVVLHRVMQSIGSFLPIPGAIMIVIAIAGGLHLNHIYHWMDTFITTEEVTVGELREYESHFVAHEDAGEAHGEEAHTDDHDHDGHGEETHGHDHGDEAHGDHHTYAQDYADVPDEELIANPHYDKIIAGKTSYLNFPFFVLRALIYILGWIWGARMLRKYSLRMDETGDVTWYKKSIRTSAIFIVFFAVTSSMMAWDWIMSIDTHWFSTLFGWYTFAGMFVTALTVITLLTLYLKSKGYLPEVNESHIHDMGKFMFAFSIFWTYLWFSQFMLIWYSNIPEEVTYYMARFDQYKLVFWSMVIINFIFPVLILMDRDAKRHYGVLAFAGIMMLVGHWLDHFVMIMPGTMKGDWHLGFVEIGMFLGYAGLFINRVLNHLTKASLVVKNHPMLKESEIHHI
jgi:hypothetical protein